MKTFKYFILVTMMVFFSLSGLNGLLGQQSSLEFLVTYSYDQITSSLEQEDRFFQLIEKDLTDPESSVLAKCSDENAQQLWEYIHSSVFLRKMPDDIRFAWGAEKNDQSLTLHALKKPGRTEPVPDRSDLLDVSIKKEDRGENWSLLIAFSEEGAEKWASFTGKNLGHGIAIVVDGKVYSAPTVNEQITQGKCMISGNFTQEDVSRLKELLEGSS